MKPKELIITDANIPQWIVDAKRKAKARERYFIKRYGSLKRMHERDGAEQQKNDDREFADEIAFCEGK